MFRSSLTDEDMTEEASRKNGESDMYNLFLMTSVSSIFLMTSLNQLFRD
ncbi:hypothetical protein MtrunA17_Chr7g0230831 [Medicago truncatula]|uniref:Transmembrane protein n=1 Tax=Medicago truncatula TaxID=3880 RepID=A0A396GYV6_MEDTR|nr:hypothetical protein MtrunA17_Chr7g0230831 [Medicago truncatula]